MTTLNENEAAERDHLIDSIAAKVVALRLESPVVFLLESHKPLSTLSHSLILLLKPLASPLFGVTRTQALLSLLAQRENLELLMQKIEIYSAAR